MSDDLSPVLSLPLIQPAQAQKHVTHNEALRLLDVLVQLSVASRSLTAPPAFPADGGRWIVAPGATADWAGQDNTIALRDQGGWAFLVPQPGWTAHVADEDRSATWTGSLWQTAAELPQRFPRLGIATDADATNRLAVAAPATLFTHDGAGHQVKLNKATAGDTASLLFQTSFSGRAEIGTTGSDSFALKVSANGSSWTTALLANGGTGQLAAPAGLAVTGAITGTAITQSATDTTAGRVMKVGDAGLLGALPVSTGTTSLRSRDLRTGLWAYATTSVPNHPEDGAAVVHGMLTLRVPAAVTGLGGDRNQYLTGRYTTSPGDLRLWWGCDSSIAGDINWAEVLTNRRLVGTVSQSGGLPTGAVIESGTNANGRYTRWADGTQVCVNALTPGTGADTIWTFPAAFSTATNLVVHVTGRTGADAVTGSARPPSVFSVAFNLWTIAGARSSGACSLTATGRWY